MNCFSNYLKLILAGKAITQLGGASCGATDISFLLLEGHSFKKIDIFSETSKNVVTSFREKISKNELTSTVL